MKISTKVLLIFQAEEGSILEHSCMQAASYSCGCYLPEFLEHNTYNESWAFHQSNQRSLKLFCKLFSFRETSAASCTTPPSMVSHKYSTSNLKCISNIFKETAELQLKHWSTLKYSHSVFPCGDVGWQYFEDHLPTSLFYRSVSISLQKCTYCLHFFF